MNKTLLARHINKTHILIGAVVAKIVRDTAAKVPDQDLIDTAKRMDAYVTGLTDAAELLFAGDFPEAGEPIHHDYVVFFGSRSIEFMGLKFDIDEHSVRLAQQQQHKP